MGTKLRFFDSDYLFDDDNGVFIARKLLDRQRLSKLPDRENHDLSFADGFYSIQSVESLWQILAALPQKFPNSVSRIPTVEEYTRLGAWSAVNDPSCYASLHASFEVVMEPTGAFFVNYLGYDELEFHAIDETYFGGGPFASCVREVVVPKSGTFSDVVTRKAEVDNAGVACLWKEDYEGAQRHFEQELRGNPTWLSHFGVAVASYVLAERTKEVPRQALETAIDHQRISVEINPWYSHSHASLGRMLCHLAIRRFNEADDLKEALRRTEKIEQSICEARTHLLKAIELDEANWSERVTQLLAHLEKFVEFFRKQCGARPTASDWWWRF